MNQTFDVRQLREIEPAIESKQLLGALYNWDEGQIDPFQLISAYIFRARQHGLMEYYFQEITGFLIEHDKLMGVTTPRGKYFAKRVILCTGAFTHQNGLLLGN